MKQLPLAELRRIAAARNIDYEPLAPTRPRSVNTRLSREFATPRSHLFKALADPMSHERLFPNILSTIVVDTSPFGDVFARNETLAVEWIREGPERSRPIAFAIYRVDPPGRIEKCVVSNPFYDPLVGHNKDACIGFEIDQVSRNRSRLTVAAEFHVSPGTVAGPKRTFVRGLIDHVWLVFLENLMEEVGEVGDRLTGRAPSNDS